MEGVAVADNAKTFLQRRKSILRAGQASSHVWLLGEELVSKKMGEFSSGRKPDLEMSHNVHLHRVLISSQRYFDGMKIHNMAQGRGVNMCFFRRKLVT